MHEKFSLEYKDQFKEVYISYYARLKRFARQYVVREEDAENIVQDIFSELWEKQLEFSSFVNLNGYLFTVLKNRCVDFLRRETLEQEVNKTIRDEQLRELKMKLESLEALDSAFLNKPDIETLIQDAIDDLPEKCREIFLMNKLEGKKQKAIARELNISIHTVESQMAIAYKKLKEALKSLNKMS
ncbi:MAG TPA: RNA polymerase sigma-70 factor [Petrimonas sp.]|jgi:RNA polymerase sigma-70 factor (ECF subfamily)|nr:RNA polymerase sigma-70 factor [Petrimonas sp.]